MLKGAFGEKNRNNFFKSVQEKLREKKDTGIEIAKLFCYTQTRKN